MTTCYHAPRETDAVARTAASGSAPHPELVSQLLGTQRHARGLAELTPRQRDVLTLMAEGPFFVLEVGSRYVHNLGVTANPDGPWTFQQATNLLTALGDRADPFKVLIRDRAGQFTAASDAVLADAGVTVYKSPPRSPRAKRPRRRLVVTAPARLPTACPSLANDIDAECSANMPSLQRATATPSPAVAAPTP